jgi:hypothetical protein
VEAQEEEPHMSEVIITAHAWVAGEPGVNFLHGDPHEFLWTMLAEASVTNADGEPISKLPKKVWKLHVTQASGVTSLPSFTVVEIVTPLAPVLPGFYLLALDEFGTPPWIAPTAFGIAIEGTVGRPKVEVRGQVVVPISLAGPTVVQTLTTPGL